MRFLTSAILLSLSAARLTAADYSLTCTHQTPCRASATVSNGNIAALDSNATTIKAGYVIYSVGALQQTTCIVQNARFTMPGHCEGNSKLASINFPVSDTIYILSADSTPLPHGHCDDDYQASYTMDGSICGGQGNINMQVDYAELDIDNISCDQPGVQVCVRPHYVVPATAGQKDFHGVNQGHFGEQRCVLANYNGVCAGLPQYAKYLGCYADAAVPQRQLPTLLGLVSTERTCLQLAKEQGFAYAGLEWYGQCWAGSALPTLGISDQCNTPSVDNSNGGGLWALSMYSVDQSDYLAPAPTAAPTQHGVVQHLGCFIDWGEDRQLPAQLADNDNNQNVTSCIRLAQDAGYSYAGLSWFGQCFAGNSVPGLGPATDCNTLCDDGTNCGGYYSLSTYRVK